MQNKIKEDLNVLSREQMDLIEIMFWGPYEPEWYDDKGRVDNRDSEIAKRVGASRSKVSEYTERISRNHFERVLTINSKK